MNERVRDYWPEDPRWGEGYIAPPLGGVYDERHEAEVNKTVATAKAIIHDFEEKYPRTHWWTTEFVENHPSAALLLQSVNSSLAFSSIAALTQLEERVAQTNEVPFTEPAPSREVHTARLAMSALLQGETAELTLAHSLLTEGDKLELCLLLNGVGRVVVTGRG